MDRATLTTWLPVVIMAIFAVGWIVRALRRAPSRWRTKLAVGSLLVAVALTCFTWGNWSTYVRTKGWTTTEATVQDVEIQTVTKTELRAHRRSVTTHEREVRVQTLELAYTVDGQEEIWTGRFDDWYSTGDTIQVKYDPGNPKSIVQVTAESDEITPIGSKTNNTVSSIGGLPAFARAALVAWIATIPLGAVLLVTWLLPRRRQADTSQPGGAEPPPSPLVSAPAWQQAPSPYQPPPGPQAGGQPWSSQPTQQYAPYQPDPGPQAGGQPWSPQPPQQYPPPPPGYRNE